MEKAKKQQKHRPNVTCFWADAIIEQSKPVATDVVDRHGWDPWLKPSSRNRLGSAVLGIGGRKTGETCPYKWPWPYHWDIQTFMYFFIDSFFHQSNHPSIHSFTHSSTHFISWHLMSFHFMPLIHSRNHSIPDNSRICLRVMLPSSNARTNHPQNWTTLRSLGLRTGQLFESCGWLIGIMPQRHWWGLFGTHLMWFKHQPLDLKICKSIHVAPKYITIKYIISTIRSSDRKKFACLLQPLGNFKPYKKLCPRGHSRHAPKWAGGPWLPRENMGKPDVSHQCWNDSLQCAPKTVCFFDVQILYLKNYQI